MSQVLIQLLNKQLINPIKRINKHFKQKLLNYKLQKLKCKLHYIVERALSIREVAILYLTTNTAENIQKHSKSSSIISV